MISSSLKSGSGSAFLMPRSKPATLGRPATRWDDVYISHRAVDDLQSSLSTDYSAFFSELKQWAGDAGVKKAIRIRDRQDNDYLLKAFRELTDEDLNPIELYAYYLGLYININVVPACGRAAKCGSICF